MVQQRNIALCIILSLVTCGIYGIYWFICMVNDVNTVSGHTSDTSGGMVFLLTLVTCGIYGIYWVYTAGSKIDEAKTARGIPSSNSNVLYLILNLVGLAIVTDALIQNELNNMAGAQPTA